MTEGEPSDVLALSGLAALFASPLWCVAVLVKLVSVALPGRRPDWAVHLLRWSAGMAVAAAVGCYLLSSGAVAFAEHESRSGADSSPAPACRGEEVPREARLRLVTHRASYFPPAFDCVLDDGTTYESSGVYDTLNTFVVAFAVGAGALAASAGFAAARRDRGQALPGADGDPSAPSGDTSDDGRHDDRVSGAAGA
ncbi:hypothetical protein G9272_03280 [Streptomyces asoensis]|uniref:Uncharacterized protein n=1 Tax=Streptomyces asoensis TaxID=249586 RepID=A0A6M4WGY8_9ACTN|nr:hypothetical protein [Streptomyces asoensis]QJS99448.1 hypothetical protein G9272_03280 [Streptomyces asoensis]